jgi:hypothetical protein
MVDGDVSEAEVAVVVDRPDDAHRLCHPGTLARSAMMSAVSATRSAKTRVAAAVAAVLLLVVLFLPVLLLGESIGAFGLIVIGAVPIGVGLLARAGQNPGLRTFGTIAVLMGAVIVAGAIVLTVLLIGGLGRGI